MSVFSRRNGCSLQMNFPTIFCTEACVSDCACTFSKVTGLLSAPDEAWRLIRGFLFLGFGVWGSARVEKNIKGHKGRKGRKGRK